MSRDYKIVRFLKSTGRVLPRNVQEIVVRKVNEENKVRRAYYKELDELLARGEKLKNLYMKNEGFRFGPSNLEYYRSMARGNDGYKRSLRNYYDKRRKFVDYVMNDTTIMTRPEKKRLVERILTDKNFKPTKDELKRYGFK
jgi:glutamate/tyrosine decarboxylase-like PLP-dependent enzyme